MDSLYYTGYWDPQLKNSALAKMLTTLISVNDCEQFPVNTGINFKVI